MKVLIAVAVVSVFMASVALGDALSRKEAERQLRSNFKNAQSFRLTGMQENYWGLYRTYHVTFNLKDSDSTYQVGCNLVDRRPAELDLTSCQAVDDGGQKISDSRARELGIRGGSSDIARLEWRGHASQRRMPASVYSR